MNFLILGGISYVIANPSIQQSKALEMLISNIKNENQLAIYLIQHINDTLESYLDYREENSDGGLDFLSNLGIKPFEA